MTRFFDRGGSIRRYERIVGEPILGSFIHSTLQSSSTHERVESTSDLYVSEFLPAALLKALNISCFDC